MYAGSRKWNYEVRGPLILSYEKSHADRLNNVDYLLIHAKYFSCTDGTDSIEMDTISVHIVWMWNDIDLVEHKIRWKALTVEVTVR